MLMALAQAVTLTPPGQSKLSDLAETWYVTVLSFWSFVPNTVAWRKFFDLILEEQFWSAILVKTRVIAL